MKLLELFDQEVNVKWVTQLRYRWKATFQVGEHTYIFDALRERLDQGGTAYEVTFGLQPEPGKPLHYDNTNTGNEFQVYANVIKCLADLTRNGSGYTPLIFEAYDTGRKRLYTRFIRKYLKDWTVESNGDSFIAYPPNWEPEEEEPDE